jgi:Protein of unknown function (DUF4239)
MSQFLSGLPLWELVLLMIVAPMIVAVGLQLVAHRWFGVEKLSQNNEVAGFQFAIVGVIYAVLLAFVVIAVWEKFSEGQTTVAQEAGAAAALFRYGEGPEPEATNLRKALAAYLTLAIERDWPAMGGEAEDAETTDALSEVYRAAMALNQSGTRNTADMSEVFAQLDNVTAARRVRLHLATGLVPDVIWVALFAGATLTIAFALFFGAENRLAQIAMTAILTILVTLGLVVIVALDHPFSGAVHIPPDSLERVLAAFKEG